MAATSKDTRKYFGGKWQSGLVSSGYTGNRVDPTKYDVNFGSLTLGESHDGVKVMRTNVGSVAGMSSPVAVGDVARNKAWSDLIDQIRSGPAALGVSLAEGQQALGMIADRFGKCYRAYKDLRRGNFRGFLKQLTIGPKRRHRNTLRNSPREASNLWLEYSFGWKPLFQDVHDAATVLTKPVPGGVFVGKGRQDFSYKYHPNGGIWADVVGVVYFKQGARVFVSNPNLFLLQSVGLANPAQIAWELVPFSFVVDWVADVGSFLGSFTDLLGCEVHGPYNTYTYKTRNVRYQYMRPTSPSISDKTATTGSVGRTQRRLGLSRPTPNLSFRANVGSSLNRAANAASLLVQILTK